jgi:hypothetical protein
MRHRRDDDCDDADTEKIRESPEMDALGGLSHRVGVPLSSEPERAVAVPTRAGVIVLMRLPREGA